MLGLVDYRRCVAALYRNLHDGDVNQASWEVWVEEREQLLLTHPQSPVVSGGQVSKPPEYFPYDPTWQVVATVDPPVTGDTLPVPDGAADFNLVGSANFSRNGVEFSLGIYWLDSYAGGLFIPFRDETNGGATYGGGRYILDTVKSADLGSVPGQPEGTLLLDFNFAYHPSCVWDTLWQCPLAPAGNHLEVAVAAGEQKPS